MFLITAQKGKQLADRTAEKQRTKYEFAEGDVVWTEEMVRAVFTPQDHVGFRNQNHAHTRFRERA